jgi:muramoyltetrapeptide carboxypeptidase
LRKYWGSKEVVADGKHKVDVSLLFSKNVEYYKVLYDINETNFLNGRLNNLNKSASSVLLKIQRLETLQVHPISMQRRDFFRNAGMTVAGLALPTGAIAAPPTVPTFNLRKPAALRPGSVVGLIAPGSPIPDLRIEQAIKSMTNLGLKVRQGRNIREQYGYLAGSDEQRLADLHWAFSDPEIEAVWCLRGGYGCGRLLQRIDYDLIGRNPKIFIGYSDITALHLAIHKMTGLVCFHGPVAASDYPDETVAHAKAVLMEGKKPYLLQVPSPNADLPGQEYKPLVITPGKARGTLTGGNLSLLAALAGTPWMPSLAGKIVFLEDVGEQPYRIDRMFVQLLQSTDLAQAAGIALGVFSDCEPKNSATISSFSFTEMLMDAMGKLGMPVLYGLPFGHVGHNATIPYEIEAALDAEQGSLTLLERAVIL